MGKKRPALKNTPNNKKSPKMAENPDSYLSLTPSWRFSQCDKEHEKWKIGADELDYEVFEKLKNFETMTWGEIWQASGGRSRGTNHHFINVKDLNKEAQKRLEDMKLYVDDVFSLRLEGTLRIFGLLGRDGVFKILWRDNNHEICPSNKKQT